MNKDWLKTFKSCCVVLFLAAQINVFTGCQDDLPADSYYTFTGEMMSDFLKNREDFSLFRRIVERAGKLDFLGTRGARTLFPPINSGVEAFLKEKGYASVEDIPVSYCDTLLKACLVERIIYTYDLGKTQQENNRPTATHWMPTTWCSASSTGVRPSSTNLKTIPWKMA